MNWPIPEIEDNNKKKTPLYINTNPEYVPKQYYTVPTE